MRLFPDTSRKNAPAPTRGQEAAEGLCEDDVDLFARLLAAHQDKLYRVAYRMAGHHEDAQDLLQDALLEAYRSFKKFQRGTYFDKWLYRIMTNTFIDRQRHKKRVGRIESLDAPMPGGESGETLGREIPDWEDEPSRKVMRDTFDEPIQKALDGLKPDFRMVLILSDVEEFSYEEISEMLDIPIGTVRSRLHRARDMMRQKLTEAGKNK